MNPKTACLKRREEEKSEEANVNKFVTLNPSTNQGPNLNPSQLAIDPSRLAGIGENDGNRSFPQYT